MGGLSYLSKKSWHPSTFKNIEQVTMAELKQKEHERKYHDHLKKIKEEREMEDLRKLQAQNKVISESAAQRIEWMYQDRSASQQANAPNTEDFLVGKPVKQAGEDDFRKKIVPVIRGDTYATPENEAFLKMIEDPLVQIKQKELEARRQVVDNPLKMKQIREEIEALKAGLKKKKKDKKKKKKKHHRRHDSSDSSDRESRRRRHYSDEESSVSERTKDRSHNSHSNYHSGKSGKSSRHRSRSDERRKHRRDSRSNSRDRHKRKSPDMIKPRNDPSYQN